LADVGWQAMPKHVARFWADALAARERHVVWFSRRVTRDYVGFLDYLCRIGDRPCDVVDLTETIVPVRGDDGAIGGSRRAICTGLLDGYQFLEGDLFGCAAPLADDVRAAYRAEWDRLRAENAPLRIVTPELHLVSVPLTHFDEELLKRIQPHLLKAARIIGQVLTEKWDMDILEVDDFFLSRRLMALVRAGKIEGRGDLTQIRFSEVRLLP
jgi:hypothetical protein